MCVNACVHDINKQARTQNTAPKLGEYVGSIAGIVLAALLLCQSKGTGWWTIPLWVLGIGSAANLLILVWRSIRYPKQQA